MSGNKPYIIPKIFRKNQPPTSDSSNRLKSPGASTRHGSSTRPGSSRTESSTQPRTSTQQGSSTRPRSSNPPESSTQPRTSTRPGSSTRTESSTQPRMSTQPGSSTRTESSTEPRTSTQPGSSTQPGVSTKQGSSTQPRSSTRTSSSIQPGSSNESGFSTRKESTRNRTSTQEYITETIREIHHPPFRILRTPSPTTPPFDRRTAHSIESFDEDPDILMQLDKMDHRKLFTSAAEQIPIVAALDDQPAIDQLAEHLAQMNGQQQELLNTLRAGQISQDNVAAQIQNLTQGILQFMQQGAQGAGAPMNQNAPTRIKFDAKSFPALALKDGQTDAERFEIFFGWEQQVRRNILANPTYNNLPFPQIGAAILSCLDGQAQRMTIALNVQQYNDIDSLMRILRETICGGAVTEKANLLFHERKQKLGEDINTYHAELQQLFIRAFPAEGDRSNVLLLRTFIEGLRDKELKKMIILRDQEVPGDYQELRNLAVRFSAKLETAKQMDRGKGSLKNHPIASDRAAVHHVPMDIGAIEGKHQRGRFQGPTRGPSRAYPPRKPESQNGVQAGNRGKTIRCFSCNEVGHIQAKCPKRSKTAAVVDIIDECDFTDDEQDQGN